MLSLFSRSKNAILDAIDRSQARIEFKPDGTILTANPNFLSAMNYSLEEIQGKHHRMFVDPAYANSLEYRDFWRKLANGEFEAGEFKRFGRGQRELWIQASYNPVFNSRGKVEKVVKFATDITAAKLHNADYEGQISAIGKSQAVIEFDLNGIILNANSNFLGATGYTLDEIKGKHHGMFVDEAYRNSAEYRDFWALLKSGTYQAAEYKRYGKGGREIWIQATYNPILDMSGQPFKVVKFATDITEQVLERQRKEKAQREIEASLAAIEQSIHQADTQTTTVCNASTETTNNVHSVASGAEELNASVHEIAASMAKSRAAADDAYTRTQTAGVSTQQLAQAAKSMTGIVELIRTIGGQINLLALNATIESARAGDAGKGFAVVANEVKNLAKQATDATERIASEIDSMQTISSDVIGALDGIRGSIEGVREYVTATAAAVEEQSAVAREMSSNMQSAANAVAAINDSIGQIASATRTASNSTAQVKEAVVTLAS